MNILIVHSSTIPVSQYGGTERVIWYLAHELQAMGHQVHFLVGEGSTCPFATVHILQKNKPIHQQIPEGIDIVHFHFIPEQIEHVSQPWVFTMHGNKSDHSPLPINTIFVSKNHAERFGSLSYVYNGLDWNDYGKPNMDKPRSHLHFLGKAAWRIKNVQGAIDVIHKTPSENLHVLGGVRFNISMGLRFTFSPRIKFFGMVGGAQKLHQLQHSKGLIFPVRWHEPFGLAITESLYAGCPIFATPYGSISELVPNEVGYLTTDSSQMAEAIMHANEFDKNRCHQYAADLFNSRKMAEQYALKYQQVLNGQSLNIQAPSLQQIPEKFLPWT